MNFFARIKKAIFNVDEYGSFLLEDRRIPFRYFLLLILIVTFFTTICQTYYLSGIIDAGIQYVNNELPDFTFEDGTLKLSQNVENAYNEKYKIRLFINTDEDFQKSKIDEYKDKYRASDKGFILLKDKMYMVSNLETFSIGEYSDFGFLKFFDISNREELKEVINSMGKGTMIVELFMEGLVVGYFSKFLIYFLYYIIILCVGYMLSYTFALKIKLISMSTLAIYSSTLPMIVLSIYECVTCFTYITISNLDKYYLFVSIIYLIAAMVVIKYNIANGSKEALDEVQNDENDKNDKGE